MVRAARSHLFAGHKVSAYIFDYIHNMSKEKGLAEKTKPLCLRQIETRRLLLGDHVDSC
jgi:hypothetical protein